MRKINAVWIGIAALSAVVMFNVEALHAQSVSASDRSTGDGGPIQADQYGPSYSYRSPPPFEEAFRSDDRLHPYAWHYRAMP